MDEYREIVKDRQAYRAWLDGMIMRYPELFPDAIGDGYNLHDERSSTKLEDVQLRRICLKRRDGAGKKQVFTIAPSGMMPYFVGWTDEVEKILILLNLWLTGDAGQGSRNHQIVEPIGMVSKAVELVSR